MAVFKSKNFDRNLDGKAMVKQIIKNLDTTVGYAKISANHRTPLDTGNLRKSARIKKTGLTSRVIEWSTTYAEKVYYKNRKNPQTTEWAKKDSEINKQLYLKKISEGVIK